MNAQEAYTAIRRAGYREGIVVRTVETFEPDRSMTCMATICTADDCFMGVDIAHACAKVIAALPKPRPSKYLAEWEYADAEAMAQERHEAFVISMLGLQVTYADEEERLQQEQARDAYYSAMETAGF